MSVIVETIVIKLDNLAQVYTVSSHRGSLVQELGTVLVNEDGTYEALSTNPRYQTPVLWQNFERSLAYLISPRGMT